MSTAIKAARSAFRPGRFFGDESGSASIEFVLMAPLFTALLLLFADASLLYIRHSTLLNISRDTARIVSRYAMTADEAQIYAAASAGTKRGSATAKVTIGNGFVTVVISTSAATAAPFGFVKFAVGDQISATAINIMEPI